MRKTLTILLVCVIIIGAVAIPISAAETDAENGIEKYDVDIDNGQTSPYPLFNTYLNFSRAWIVGGEYFNVPIRNTYSEENVYNIGYSVGVNDDKLIMDDFLSRNELDPTTSHFMTFYDLSGGALETITLHSDYMILDDQTQSDAFLEVEVYDGAYIDKVVFEFDVMNNDMSVISHATNYEITHTATFETLSFTYNYLDDETSYIDLELGLDDIYADLASKPEFEEETSFFCTNVRITVTFDNGLGTGASTADIMIQEPISLNTANPNPTIEQSADWTIFAQKNFVQGDFDFLSWISSQIDKLLNIKILPTVTIGAILWSVIALALLCWMLKVFLGG